MKGLLVKDMKLILLQKNFFLLIFAVAVGMVTFTEDISFPLGFMTFVISLFAVTTISYDEFDNGNAFLFTLPITRKEYVVGKYCLSLLLGGGTWILASALVTAVSLLKGTYSVPDVLVTALAVLALDFIIPAVMLPFQIKFGGEKGRITIIAVIGMLSVAGAVITKAAEMAGIDFLHMLEHLPTINIGALLVLLILVSVIFFVISMNVSIRVMNKKEF